MSWRPEIEAAVEAILFAAGEPVSRQRLLAAFDEEEREEAGAALAAVEARYAPAEGRGVAVESVGGGVRLVTRPELHPYLQRFFEAGGQNRLSMAALETLAIVAYRQPVTAPEVQELRGVSSSGVLKTLLDRRLVRIAGRKQVVGKPFLYATSREFLLQFGLDSLKELPPLEEFEEMLAGEEGAELAEGPGRGGPGRDEEASEVEGSPGAAGEGDEEEGREEAEPGEESPTEGDDDALGAGLVPEPEREPEGGPDREPEPEPAVSGEER